MEALETGSVIAGRFVLAKEVGRGTTGVVFRADDRQSGQPVALKVMSSRYEVDSESRKRFLREARVAAELDHEGAVSVLDYGDDDGTLYLVMDALDGESLRARLSQRVAPLEEIISVGSTVADVLSAAHEIDLIHRDIKPENIFVLAPTQAGASAEPERLAVRVLDFGLAFLAEHDGSLGRLTMEGVLSGTPAYMSPEQAQSDPLTAATDVYSLGCVLYEMASGEVPFLGSVPETLARHVYVAPVPLASKKMARPIPKTLTTLIEEMLAKPATSRPTPADVAARLKQL